MKYLKIATRGILFALAAVLAGIADGAEWLSGKCLLGRDGLK